MSENMDEPGPVKEAAGDLTDDRTSSERAKIDQAAATSRTKVATPPTRSGHRHRDDDE